MAKAKPDKKEPKQTDVDALNALKDMRGWQLIVEDANEMIAGFDNVWQEKVKDEVWIMRSAIRKKACLDLLDYPDRLIAKIKGQAEGGEASGESGSEERIY